MQAMLAGGGRTLMLANVKVPPSIFGKKACSLVGKVVPHHGCVHRPPASGTRGDPCSADGQCEKRF